MLGRYERLDLLLLLSVHVLAFGTSWHHSKLCLLILCCTIICYLQIYLCLGLIQCNVMERNQNFSCTQLSPLIYGNSIQINSPRWAWWGGFAIQGSAHHSKKRDQTRHIQINETFTAYWNIKLGKPIDRRVATCCLACACCRPEWSRCISRSKKHENSKSIILHKPDDLFFSTCLYIWKMYFVFVSSMCRMCEL